MLLFLKKVKIAMVLQSLPVSDATKDAQRKLERKRAAVPGVLAFLSWLGLRQSSIDKTIGIAILFALKLLIPISASSPESRGAVFLAAVIAYIVVLAVGSWFSTAVFLGLMILSLASLVFFSSYRARRDFVRARGSEWRNWPDVDPQA